MEQDRKSKRTSILLKYGFCKKSLRKNETDLEKKWAKSVQLVRVSFFPSEFLQNPYFSAALKNPSQDFKSFFALGANEFLAMLEGKIRETPFLKVQSG